MGRWFLFGFLFFLVSCATLHGGGEVLYGIDQPLIDLQKLSESVLPMGKRTISSNGREILSNYFHLVDGRIVAGDRAPERFYAHVIILGDQRPYTIEVIVHRERRVASSGELSPRYDEVAVDQRLAKVFAKRLNNNLSKRREDRSIIDDFRVF